MFIAIDPMQDGESFLGFGRTPEEAVMCCSIARKILE